MEVARLHELVMCRRVKFGVVIGHVALSWSPINVEFSLLDPISDPVETHVDGMGALLLDVVVGNAAGSGIVGLDWHGWLWMAHFL
jgi:hypothetical protein